MNGLEDLTTASALGKHYLSPLVMIDRFLSYTVPHMLEVGHTTYYTFNSPQHAYPIG